MEESRKKGNPGALLPIGIFLILFLGVGLLSGDFYAMPAIVAFLIALVAAFFQNRERSFGEKLKTAAEGIFQKVITIVMMFGSRITGVITALLQNA